MFRAMVTDDEGKRVPLVRFNLSDLPLPSGPLPPHVQRTIRMEIDRKGMRGTNVSQLIVRHALPAVLIVSSFCGVVGIGVVLGFPTTAVALGSILVFFFVRAASWMSGPFMLSDRARQLAVEITVAAGCCGSCGYLLAEHPNTDAGLCRCPECGAAWRRG